MAAPSQPCGPGTSLVDRHSERLVLDRLVDAVRSRSSRALVVHGQAGIGEDGAAGVPSKAACRRS